MPCVVLVVVGAVGVSVVSIYAVVLDAVGPMVGLMGAEAPLMGVVAATVRIVTVSVRASGVAESIAGRNPVTGRSRLLPPLPAAGSTYPP
ncbi:hypothetical protein OHA61_27310 [Streptomyces sp. NBC_00885]|uniref:hypothetical protein n=1 Tax=Streptomyces sp. NBC_00885 TaxID=2975857 RepID=UPI00386FCE7D|nr:hypothetical protein OHA61_27310 [Streptomyces sp. NBC_00885]